MLFMFQPSGQQATEQADVTRQEDGAEFYRRMLEAKIHKEHESAQVWNVKCATGSKRAPS